MKNTVENMLHFYSQLRKLYINEFTRRFQNENFSPNELDLMLFLHNNPSINTASQLCTCLNVSKALICRSVDSLSHRELLTTQPDLHDRRVQRLHLTEKADPVIRKLLSAHETLNAEILKDISPEDLRQMERTMDRILELFQEKEKGD